jgi:ATP-binding cassette subfamily B protein
VLVLDEPTSALDPENEKNIAQNLRRHFRDRTVVVITHRPALAEIADQIIHLREGKAWIELASASR